MSLGLKTVHEQDKPTKLFISNTKIYPVLNVAVGERPIPNAKVKGKAHFNGFTVLFMSTTAELSFSLVK
jgi:hypothetical protein